MHLNFLKKYLQVFQKQTAYTIDNFHSIHLTLFFFWL